MAKLNLGKRRGSDKKTTDLLRHLNFFGKANIIGEFSESLFEQGDPLLVGLVALFELQFSSSDSVNLVSHLKTGRLPRSIQLRMQSTHLLFGFSAVAIRSELQFR